MSNSHGVMRTGPLHRTPMRTGFAHHVASVFVKASSMHTHASVRTDACVSVVLCAQAGGDAPTSVGHNYQLAWSSQSPVTELPPSRVGFHDVMGSAWEWAEDHYAAYPGFKVGVHASTSMEGHVEIGRSIAYRTTTQHTYSKHGLSWQASRRHTVSHWQGP